MKNIREYGPITTCVLILEALNSRCFFYPFVVKYELCLLAFNMQVAAI